MPSTPPARPRNSAKTLLRQPRTIGEAAGVLRPQPPCVQPVCPAPAPAPRRRALAYRHFVQLDASTGGGRCGSPGSRVGRAAMRLGVVCTAGPGVEGRAVGPARDGEKRPFVLYW